MWSAFAASGVPHAHEAIGASYTAWQFGYGEEQGDRLLDYVLHGPKRATTGALWAYEHDDEPLPVTGTFSVVTDGRGVARCVIRTSSVEVLPFCEVGEQHAWDEGEGDRSLAYWREGHWSYFVREMESMGRTAVREMPVVFERFDVVYAPEIGIA
jgi:uncharacterized protein YhfF